MDHALPSPADCSATMMPITPPPPPFAVGDNVIFAPRPDGAEEVVLVERSREGEPLFYVRTRRGARLVSAYRYAPETEFVSAAPGSSPPAASPAVRWASPVTGVILAGAVNLAVWGAVIAVAYSRWPQ